MSTERTGVCSSLTARSTAFDLDQRSMNGSSGPLSALCVSRLDCLQHSGRSLGQMLNCAKNNRFNAVITAPGCAEAIACECHKFATPAPLTGAKTR